MQQRDYSFARRLGVTEAQYRAGLKRNADDIRAYSDVDLKRWGKTRQEADAIAADYALRSDAPTSIPNS